MQTRIARGFFFACSLVLGVALAAPTAGAQKKDKDTVSLKGGKSESGKIVSEDFAGLGLEVKPGQTKNIPWSEVTGVDYAGTPELAAALDALNSGRLDDAQKQFLLLAESAKKNPVVQQEALYNSALIRERQGKLDEAISGYQALFEAFPKGRYLRSAGERWIGCLLAKGDTNGAEAAVSKIGVGAQGLDAAKADLALLRGEVLLAKGSWGEARSSFESAASAAGANASAALEAKLGLARALVGEKKLAEAEPLLREIVKSQAPNQVLAGAWNALGEIQYEEGRAKRNTDQLLDGLFMFLRGVVQYAPLPGEQTSEYEHALAGASKCFRALSELDQNAERKKLNRQRADENLARLKKDFPSSPYLRGL